MTLPGTVQPADDGLRGFDADTIVKASDAAEFVSQGFRFCLRYISHDPLQGPSDLSALEAVALLNAGLALMPVQHVRQQPWGPTKDLGGMDGVCAAYHSFVIGFPAGVNLWCDLEGIGAGVPDQQVIGYCNAWFDAVAAAGYVPGIYVGADCILNGQALRFRLKFAHYWKSLSDVPDIPGRGYQMIQSAGQPVADVDTDLDRTQTDLLGDKVVWLAPPAVIRT